ncbi:DEAD/DEAH box helicase family protein [Streptomyces cacaoi]
MGEASVPEQGGQVWAGPGSPVSTMIMDQSERYLRAYSENPTLVQEHANIERSTTQGGYGRRQLYELVQNGADELLQETHGGMHVVLTEEALYCANLGRPVSPGGVETILASHLSRKRGTEIGRFGLGFKSVLAVSANPQFFSRSGSFGWDAEKTRRLIRERVPGDGDTPVLRIAHLLDFDVERHADPVLEELSWATTIVKLPLMQGHSQALAADLAAFPSNFVIFSPHVGELVLEDRRGPTPPVRRDIYVRGSGNTRTLHTDEHGNKSTSEWKVFEKVHLLSEAARKDAGEFHVRTEVPVSWAVPTTGQQGPGEFWAFFPTTYETTLRGVLNAPWKTNEDRQNLLKNNAFNEELMEVAAKLVVDSLPDLSTPENPSRHLYLITARGRESRNWADGLLTELVQKTAARRPSLPDQNGVLRKPAEISLHPANLDKKWLERWSAYPGRPDDWCHPTVEETTPRSRAETFLGQIGREAATVRGWLEALVADGTAAASAVALGIVADMVHRDHALAASALQARVLRSDTGRFVAPVADAVFRRTALDTPADDMIFVDPQLEADETADWALRVLHIREADATGRFAAVVKQGFKSYTTTDWERFWQLTRSLRADDAACVLADRGVLATELRVRVADGTFQPFDACLLPGPVARPGGDDDGIVVDLEFHRDDAPLLRELGAADSPHTKANPDEAEWFDEYREAAVESYYEQLDSGPRPRESSIAVDGPPIPGPLELLPRLSLRARARFLTEIPVSALVRSWTVEATTRKGRPRLEIGSPLAWMARRHGAVPTSQGIRSPRDCVGPALGEYRRFLPVAETTEELASLLGLPATVGQISEELWGELLETARHSEEAEQTGALYALAAPWLMAPATLRCRVGDGWSERHPAQIAVTTDRREYERLCHQSLPALLVPTHDQARSLVTEWELLSFSDVLTTELRATPVDAETPLEDVFPKLRMLPQRPLRGLQLIRCSELAEVSSTPQGRVVDDLPIGYDQEENVVYWCEIDDDLALLSGLSRLLRLGWSDDYCRDVLRHREEARKSARVVAVRNQDNDASRLSSMLPEQAIRDKLPRDLVEYVEATEGHADHRRLAELALSAYGHDVLREYRSELEAAGFVVPLHLAGGSEARSFVAELGFSSEYAGFSKPALDPSEVIDGPVTFPKLHEYQDLMVRRMTDVLTTRPPGRGMLSLPTGAGKTRIAIEALVRTMRDTPVEKRAKPVLWIAQTEELCEQAVQSWSFVWRHIGPADRLTISRLWYNNHADPVPDGHHVVVATDAKLRERLPGEDYAWLREAQAVVVDEAHVSLAPSYTEVFEQLGISRHRTRCPLVGLTATPFRGSDTDETRRLVNRYSGVRIDHDEDGRAFLGEEPYRTLQDFGVLARVQHRQLDGVEARLTDDEAKALEATRRLPSSVEKRLGRDAARNKLLLDTVEELPQDWPVLLFSASVDHARSMSALLESRGITAANISSETPPPSRRHIVDRFRAGEIRVLANYGVLTQGFDAPATRAVIVARPTYSPNVYQQMIGRGLRGPANGGNEECLIVNVADNFDRYGEDLAFRQFEYLWKQR